MRNGFSTSEKIQFRNYFGLNLSDYWEDPAFLGFDVIKFDAYLETPDGISTLAHISNTVSKQATEFVEGLLEA